jgi:Concanavalin A-like lectin/glucanases superfamily
VVHEGIAASLADAPTCTPGVTRGIDDLRRLDRNRAWADYTNQPGTIDRTYCEARVEVEAWIHHFDTPHVFALLDAVRDGAAFYAVYGPMLTQTSQPISTVVMSRGAAIDDRALSIAMWIRPTARGGTLAHVSSTEIGTGWCTPLLGYTGDGRLVAQVLVGNGADAADFARATDPKRRALGTWTHVAMTWSPTSGERLYVDGVLAATSATLRRRPVVADAVYVTWGSQNLDGASSKPASSTHARLPGSRRRTRGVDVSEPVPYELHHWARRSCSDRVELRRRVRAVGHISLTRFAASDEAEPEQHGREQLVDADHAEQQHGGGRAERGKIFLNHDDEHER